MNLLIFLTTYTYTVASPPVYTRTGEELLVTGFNPRSSGICGVQSSIGVHCLRNTCTSVSPVNSRCSNSCTFMEPLPAGRQATEEIPCISWKAEGHYDVHNSPPLVSVLSQMDPVEPPPILLLVISFTERGWGMAARIHPIQSRQIYLHETRSIPIHHPTSRQHSHSR